MQNYKVIHGNSSVKSSRTIINDDIQTAISNNSGTAFPTANLMEGMKCYRTDLKRTFTLVDVDTKKWEPDDAGGTAKTANKLTTARTINVTGKATGSAQFDGSADINLKLTTVNADTAATATVANSAKACTGNSVTASQVAWNGVIGKPSSYPPAAHNHDAAYPSTTGARASGTWDINITGTAGGVSWTNVQGRPGTLEPYYANNKWYAVGDDIYMGDHNIGGCLCLKSTNGTTGVALFQQSNDQNYASIKFDGSNLLVSHTVKGTITNASYANSAGNADTVDGWHRDDIRAWGNITGKPATATRWPSWDEVTGKPASVTRWPSWDEVTGKPASVTRWPSWDEVTNKPSTFAPSNHAHSWSQITGKPETATRWPTWNEITGKPATVGNSIYQMKVEYAERANMANTANQLDGHWLYEIVDRISGKDKPNMTPLINWDKMKSKNNGIDVRNIIDNPSTTGLRFYGGDSSRLNYGDIYLKKSYRLFDKILIVFANDDGDKVGHTVWESWMLEFYMQTFSFFNLVNGLGMYWCCTGNGTAAQAEFRNKGARYSYDTCFVVPNLEDYRQNCSVYEIYGINY